jgi:hypothetical protein
MPAASFSTSVSSAETSFSVSAISVSTPDATSLMAPP